MIVGCERQEQLDGVFHAAAAPLSLECMQRLKRFAISDDTVINPSRWK